MKTSDTCVQHAEDTDRNDTGKDIQLCSVIDIHRLTGKQTETLIQNQ